MLINKFCRAVHVLARSNLRAVAASARMAAAGSAAIAPASHSVASAASVSPTSSLPVVATVSINGRDCIVTCEPGVNAAAAIASVPFQDWLQSIDADLLVSSLHLQGVDMFGPRVGFIKFKANATYHGLTIPGIVFMRGGAVAILVVLECEGSRWAVCCRQPRLPCGSASFLEIPAGMLDGSGKFTGVAAKELKEETGLDIKDDELVDLTGLVYGAGAVGSSTRGWYPSVGACDEFLRLMYFSKAVSRAELEELRGKATGCIEEGEVITLELVKLDELWRICPDGKTLAALYLYEKLRAAGEIK